jgi:MFS family permease
MTFDAAQTSPGKLCKYCNPKWSFPSSMLIFEVGSLICGVTPNSKSLWSAAPLLVWAVQVYPSVARVIMAISTPPQKRPIMMGLVGTTCAISAVLGPLISGAFTDKVSRRWYFYINLSIGDVVPIALFFFLHLPAATAPSAIPWSQKLLRPDPVGIVLAMGNITSFVLALQYEGGSNHPWDSSVVVRARAIKCNTRHTDLILGSSYRESLGRILIQLSSRKALE